MTKLNKKQKALQGKVDSDKLYPLADALAIVTEWNEFRTPDFVQIKSRMRAPAIFDGRNIYDLEDIPSDFYYSSIGREIIYPK